jgi:hypothetical protein
MKGAEAQHRRAAIDARTSRFDGHDRWLAYVSRLAWRQGQYTLVLQLLGELQRRRPLRWIEGVRRLAAFAALQRWSDALAELDAHASWYAASPELLFFEAVARTHLGERGAAARLCQPQLKAAVGTNNPDRAYWTVRTCLLVQAPDLDWQAVAALADRTPVGSAHGATDAILRAAVLARRGYGDEAITQLRKATQQPSVVTPTYGLLFLALAEAEMKRVGDARGRLKIVSWPQSRPLKSFLAPWLDAESMLLQAEAVRALGRSGRNRAGRVSQ